MSWRIVAVSCRLENISLSKCHVCLSMCSNCHAIPWDSSMLVIPCLLYHPASSSSRSSGTSSSSTSSSPASLSWRSSTRKEASVVWVWGVWERCSMGAETLKPPGGAADPCPKSLSVASVWGTMVLVDSAVEGFGDGWAGVFDAELVYIMLSQDALRRSTMGTFYANSLLLHLALDNNCQLVASRVSGVFFASGCSAV
jgi:hypothetical protein